MRIANDPSGKKCGPKLFPMMFEKISPVNACPPNAVLKAACLIEKSPRIVIGQLFMKLAPTVTIKLGARIERTEGKEPAETKACARKSVKPMCALILGQL